VHASLIVQYSVVGMVVQCRATYVISPQVVVQPGSLHVGLLAGWVAASASCMYMYSHVVLARQPVRQILART
jgi:hypothetical protein